MRLFKQFAYARPTSVIPSLHLRNNKSLKELFIISLSAFPSSLESSSAPVCVSGYVWVYGKQYVILEYTVYFYQGRAQNIVG